jgi:hypothetical protein
MTNYLNAFKLGGFIKKNTRSQKRNTKEEGIKIFCTYFIIQNRKTAL